METKAVRNGLKAVLDGGSLGVTIAYPNVNEDAGTRPRIECRVVGAQQTGGTLKGNEVHREEATFFAIVVVDHGKGENAALDYADSIAALFTEGSTISITGGTIYIIARPNIRDGIPEDEGYRVPVAIRYRAEAD